MYIQQQLQQQQQQQVLLLLLLLLHQLLAFAVGLGLRRSAEQRLHRQTLNPKPYSAGGLRVLVLATIPSALGTWGGFCIVCEYIYNIYLLYIYIYIHPLSLSILFICYICCIYMAYIQAYIYIRIVDISIDLYVDIDIYGYM